MSDAPGRPQLLTPCTGNAARSVPHRNPAALAVNGGSWREIDDLEIATCAWVSWSNEERLHSELGMMRPVEFELRHQPTTVA